MSAKTRIYVKTRSGRNRSFLSEMDPTRIVGLDADGRIVVNDFDAFRPDRASTVRNYGGVDVTESPFLFGLTLCCNASDKGVEDGVVCRGCYGEWDTGNYVFMNADRTYDFDPAEFVQTGTGPRIQRFSPLIPEDAIAVVEDRPAPDFATQMAEAGF